MTQEEKQSDAPEATPAPVAALVKFDFDGDDLDIVPGSGEAHVVVRRVCEVLGVSYPAQLAKLKTDPSICVAIIATQIPGDDQRREVACIDIRSLPLWLATIHPNKVKTAVRPKLIRYKRLCGEVLADRFIGPRAPIGTDVTLLQALRTLVNAALDRGKIGVVIAFANAAKGMGMDGWSQLDLFGRSSCARPSK